MNERIVFFSYFYSFCFTLSLFNLYFSFQIFLSEKFHLAENPTYYL